MKLASISLSVLALTLAAAAAPAFSADLSVQADVFGSQAKLDSGDTTFKDNTTGTKQVVEGEGKADSIDATGLGVSLQYKLNEAVHVGGGLSWANYDGGKGKGEFDDMAIAANASYDFFKQDALALYGLGGLSYHMVDTKDQKSDNLKIKTDAAQLLNYDLGVGGRYEVAPNVNLSLAYRFSDTLAKGTGDTTVSAAGVNVATAKTKDVTLQKNDFIASVGYSF